MRLAAEQRRSEFHLGKKGDRILKTSASFAPATALAVMLLLESAWCAVAEDTPTQAPATISASGRGAGHIRLLAKEVFLQYDGRRPPAAGFVTYVSKTK